MAEVAFKKCKRAGCQKQYQEQDNEGQNCFFHPGKPMFHDTKKGWTCCNAIVYDWDEFSKIKPCAVGQHSDIDPNQSLSGQDQFFKSSTVENAKNAQDKFEDQQSIKINKISDYNKVESQKVQVSVSTEKQYFKTKNGLLKCINKGCQKEFDETQNTDESCNFHPGEPCFHDLRKFWNCCKKEAWDWDEFMKIPTCNVGKHIPKTI